MAIFSERPTERGSSPSSTDDVEREPWPLRDVPSKTRSSDVELVEVAKWLTAWLSLLVSVVGQVLRGGLTRNSARQ
jgi:hypothetical protein